MNDDRMGCNGIGPKSFVIIESVSSPSVKLFVTICGFPRLLGGSMSKSTLITLGDWDLPLSVMDVGGRESRGGNWWKKILKIEKNFRKTNRCNRLQRFYNRFSTNCGRFFTKYCEL
jgi:hypothetical protein